MQPSEYVLVVDSHTEGEPTRVVIENGPDLGQGSMAERLARLRSEFDWFRSGIVCEPRGSEAVVGALLLTAQDPDAVAGVIFFNDVGYLGMCGHGTIGVIKTLAYLRKVSTGWHTLETPAGKVTAYLHPDGSVTIRNVESFRLRADVHVLVPTEGTVVGDIAWGGNWFFLVTSQSRRLSYSDRSQLVEAASAIRKALAAEGITAPDGHGIDHIEFFSAPDDPSNSSKNFVLCPGASYDRSPCGTGTSAKMACLYADGKLAEADLWRQEGILGTVFEGSVRPAGDGAVIPSIRGRAWITGESRLVFSPDDPFRAGIGAP